MGFSQLSDPSFGNKASGIQIAMTGNAGYPTPIPAIADIGTMVFDYIGKLSVAQSRDRNAVAAKNQVRLLLSENLKMLGNYVTLTANGDRLMLISSGFDLNKRGETVPLLYKPRNMQVADGENQGESFVSVDGIREAKSYLYQYTLDPLLENSIWITRSGTARSFTFTNMPLSIRYWYRIGAVGTNGQLIYSNAVSRMLQ